MDAPATPEPLIVKRPLTNPWNDLMPENISPYMGLGDPVEIPPFGPDKHFKTEADAMVGGILKSLWSPCTEKHPTS